MERLDRMFMEAAARAAAASTRAPAGGDAEGEDEAEADLSAADHILRACAKGDVFAALALPRPRATTRVGRCGTSRTRR